MSAPRPLGLAGSLPWFLAPALCFALILHVTIPAADRLGLPLVWNFSLQAPLPFLLMLALGWYGLRREGMSWTWTALASRLRLQAPSLPDIAWGLGLGLAFLASYRALAFTADWLFSLPGPGLPEWLMRYRGPGSFLGQPLAGNAWLLLIPWGLFLLNVIAEELYWRAYLLPRQQLALGSLAWLAHGLLWALFHLGALYVEVLSLLPGCLALAALCAWRRSTWVGILAHAVLNVQGPLAVLNAWQAS